MEFRYTIKREYVDYPGGLKATGAWILFDMYKNSEIVFYDWKYLEEYIANHGIQPLSLDYKT
jgi:hypothetical protein